MYISIAKDNSSPASQVGHTATYVMTLDGGYTLLIYFSFTFFIFSLMWFCAVLHGSLGWFPPIEPGLLSLLVRAKYLQLFQWGLVGTPAGASLSSCIFHKAQSVFTVVWLGRGSQVSCRCRRNEIALLRDTSGNNTRALLACAQR